MKYIFFILFVLPLTSMALPSSARLFQTSYAFKTSCLLCHSEGGGSSLTPYGKDFLKAGANLASFKKIEDRDSDGDGIKNLAEILARSNPGDKKSTLENKGEWLAKAGSIFIPEKQLDELFAKVFTKAIKYSAIEGALSADQITYMKSKLSKDIADDDRVPTFYFAEVDGKKEAVAQLITEKSASQSIVAGVAVAPSGKLKSIKIFDPDKSLDNSLTRSEAFLTKLKEVDLTTLKNIKPTQDSEKVIYSVVERNLLLMSVVFGGAK
jgi:hypothetical protein